MKCGNRVPDPVLGLYDFGLRWYCAATGRWLSRDPITEASGWNLYAFCGNDGVNFVDPVGLRKVISACQIKAELERGNFVIRDPNRPGEFLSYTPAEIRAATAILLDIRLGEAYAYDFAALAIAAQRMNSVLWRSLPQDQRELLTPVTDPTGYLVDKSGIVDKGAEVAGTAAARLVAGLGGDEAAQGFAEDVARGVAREAIRDGVDRMLDHPGLDSGRAPDPDSAASGAPAGGGTAAPAAEKPVWPKTAQEMDDILKMSGEDVPDATTTPGRNKTVWRPNANTKITLEEHPYHADAPDWHRGPHWHLDTPAETHRRFVPGDPIPGYE